ncbi:hypothetical protein [Streptococcus danieliae]|uniref:hypothetical protein n=1 Tax=Streptococcus danieliae TaxID=747656 RepID=UPI0021CA1483|nr:hypothetical protein [Streptococcus danieliae]MCU0082171.1 hypothetical protein [Streptococcus danieliae]
MATKKKEQQLEALADFFDLEENKMRFSGEVFTASEERAKELLEKLPGIVANAVQE